MAENIQREWADALRAAEKYGAVEMKTRYKLSLVSKGKPLTLPKTTTEVLYDFDNETVLRSIATQPKETHNISIKKDPVGSSVTVDGVQFCALAGREDLADDELARREAIAILAQQEREQAEGNKQPPKKRDKKTPKVKEETANAESNGQPVEAAAAS